MPGRGNGFSDADASIGCNTRTCLCLWGHRRRTQVERKFKVTWSVPHGPPKHDIFQPGPGQTTDGTTTARCRRDVRAKIGGPCCFRVRRPRYKAVRGPRYKAIRGLPDTLELPQHGTSPPDVGTALAVGPNWLGHRPQPKGSKLAGCRKNIPGMVRMPVARPTSIAPGSGSMLRQGRRANVKRRGHVHQSKTLAHPTPHHDERKAHHRESLTIERRHTTTSTYGGLCTHCPGPRTKKSLKEH